MRLFYFYYHLLGCVPSTVLGSSCCCTRKTFPGVPLDTLYVALEQYLVELFNNNIYKYAVIGK